jgi:Galactose oxidase-like, Early set domain
MGRSRSAVGLTIASVSLGAMLVLHACHDESEPVQPNHITPAAGGTTTLERNIKLSYLCGNTFRVTNANAFDVPVVWKVKGATEQGSLTLPKAPTGEPGFSETKFTTQRTGTVDLYYNGHKIATKGNSGTPCAPPPPPTPAPGTPAAVGQWDAPVFGWPDVAIDLTLLPSGKVLTWGRTSVPPQVWDPATGAFAPVPSPSLLFCAGHAELPDGRLFVAGGHIDDYKGLPNGNVFNGDMSNGNQTWTAVAPMAKGRWYPSVTTMGTGEIAVLAGTDETAANVTVPEVWTGSSWRSLTTAAATLSYYPRQFLAPNGKLFYAGEDDWSHYLDVSGTGAWDGTWYQRIVATRDYGSAAMYLPGKILYVGGGAPTNTAETIDLTSSTPHWTATGSMAYARRHLNATILADGKVLVTGGTSGSGFSDEATAVFPAELWDPATGKWSTMASAQEVRVYHSTALLLTDGRVLTAGGGDGANVVVRQLNSEIYWPPYLFNTDGTVATRPTITSVNPTGTVGYGAALTISTPDAATITKVTWVRLGSVTHAFNMNQRINILSFQQIAGGISANVPSDPNLAPPGDYMLFILNGQGVPSVAKILNLR